MTIVIAILASSLAGQLPVPFEPARTGPMQPVNDPIVVRGCVEGHTLRILRDDTNELPGMRDIRLTGPRSVMAVLKDYASGYVEVSGLVDRGRRDRIETRKKTKLGKGGTITIAAAGEQRGRSLEPFADPVLRVTSITPLGERCPGNAAF